jgi:UDP-N-acetylmuramate dehydrogenase
MTGTTGPGPARRTPPPFDPIAVGSEIQRRLGVKTSRDEPLARFTTMRVGGPADLFAVAHNAFELRGLVRFARSRGLRHVVLGRASDVVVADAGIRGLVIQVRAEGLEISDDRLIAEAGVPMARAATEAQKAGLTGLEFGLAIPGTIGGAVWANAGAHGSSIAEILESATVLLADGTEAGLRPDELGFAYRESRLKHAPAGYADDDPLAPREIVVAATFRLAPAAPDEIGARLDEIKRWRRTHQPLGLPSAGSVFRNPPGGPSAGALIERAGLKGLRVGGASVSEKHANFIVNDGHGSAADVRRLVDRVREEIRRRDGIELVLEIDFIGDWSGDEAWSSAADEGTPVRGASVPAGGDA